MDVFGAEPATAESVIDVTVLHAKIGEPTLANDFLAGALKEPVLSLSKGRSVAGRKAMIDRSHALTLVAHANDRPTTTMWTAPPCKVSGRASDRIARVHMSGLSLRPGMDAGQDGFRDMVSEQRPGP